MNLSILKYCILLLFCWQTIVIAQSSNDYELDVSYQYGNYHIFPSLFTNEGVLFDKQQSYTLIEINGSMIIADNLSYEGSVQVTDLPNELINTKYSRGDYPLSTGRLQRSVVNYNTTNFVLRVGRDDMLSSKIPLGIADYPLSGDGFSWRYDFGTNQFKHVFQVLPGETVGDEVFRRTISYHHLSRNFKNITLGVGEYLILTGSHIGLDLKRLNPFLPFMLNSFDSEKDFYAEFNGDSDNSMIKLFIDWISENHRFRLNLYIDEFQIDPEDRENNSDALLFNLLGNHENHFFGRQTEIKWGFSVSNPNFGQHPGPFTAPTVGVFPLLEYSPGLQRIGFFDIKCQVDESWHIGASGYSERWLDLRCIAPSMRNKLDQLNLLEQETDHYLGFRVGFRTVALPIMMTAHIWKQSHNNDLSASVKLNYHWSRVSKQ